MTIYSDRVTLRYTGHQSTPPMPTARLSRGLNSKQRTRILRACDYLSSLRTIAPSISNACDVCYFLTLTHAVPVSGKESKRRLSNFLKMVAKHYPLTQYIWVCEIQPHRFHLRGEAVQHYHLLMFAPPENDFIRETWRRIDNPQGVSIVDVQIARNPAGYMAKYLSKDVVQDDLPPVHGNRVGIDQRVSKALKPLHTTLLEPSNWFDTLNPPRNDFGVKFDLFMGENFSQCVWGFKNLPSIATAYRQRALSFSAVNP